MAMERIQVVFYTNIREAFNQLRVRIDRMVDEYREVGFITESRPVSAIVDAYKKKEYP